MGRSRETDVRFAAPGPAGRHHTRYYVPDGARDQHTDLSSDRRARTAPSHFPSRERPRKAGEAGEDQCVSRVALRVFSWKTEGHAGWRRYIAGPFDVYHWQRPRQSIG